MAPSRIWKYFTKYGNSEIQCSICCKKLKTGGRTTNMLCHLRRKHPKCSLEEKCDDPCIDHQCGPGESCVPHQVYCIRAPCCKLPRCTTPDDQGNDWLYQFHNPINAH